MSKIDGDDYEWPDADAPHQRLGAGSAALIFGPRTSPFL